MSISRNSTQVFALATDPEEIAPPRKRSSVMHFRKTRILIATLSLRKIWNFGLLFWSFQWARILRKPIHWGNPAKIGVEPTTSCNLRCPECPSGLRSFTRPTGMLDLPAFQAMADALHRDLVYMLMYFQGEPYLNPQFLPMAAYAAKRKIYVATSTNAHYLTDQNARATVESGIHEVVVSIDGATQETYEQYRVGGNLQKVKEGTRRLVAWRDQLQSRTPYIILQFLVTGANEHEIAQIEALGKELGVDKVVFKTAQIYDYQGGSPLIPQNERYARYRKGDDGKYQLKNQLKNQCWKLWMGAEITWDGRVLPCCFDKDAQYEMGKLPETDFQTIWRGEAYQQFRGNLVRSRGSIDICTNCSEGTEIWA
jgi:radical SAM protein with 4Fe4S-binding SPASM domain